ncbi:hypothetical protein CSAL01_10992 [Colletotrichum salicis]|uniref:Uncharacterized protein n=1 Tax=Colletotrichum salicis TaxID=1209931 RepID=A0A135V1U0_9PEZI|nr:hypothetical protein CSAL01_10992 [Colletotrichum salicis]
MLIEDDEDDERTEKDKLLELMLIDCDWMLLLTELTVILGDELKEDEMLVIEAVAEVVVLEAVGGSTASTKPILAGIGVVVGWPEGCWAAAEKAKAVKTATCSIQPMVNYAGLCILPLYATILPPYFSSVAAASTSIMPSHDSIDANVTGDQDPGVEPVLFCIHPDGEPVHRGLGRPVDGVEYGRHPAVEPMGTNMGSLGDFCKSGRAAWVQRDDAVDVGFHVRLEVSDLELGYRGPGVRDAGVGDADVEVGGSVGLLQLLHGVVFILFRQRHRS